MQSQLDTNDENINTLKSESESKLSITAKQLNEKLDVINSSTKISIDSITLKTDNLQSSDNNFEKKLTELRTYTENELGNEKDWVNATFATLTQYQNLQSEISNINANIQTINNTIENLKNSLDTQVTEFKTEIATLDSSFNSKITQITNDYTTAVNNAKDELTKAYTTAIQTAISKSENEIKKWVNSTLQDGYYTISQIDSKINELKATDTSLATELNAQQSALTTAKSELTSAYTSAITSAINDNNGKISQEIATSIDTAKSSLQSSITVINQQINEINAEITSIKSRLSVLENSSDSGIQSLVYKKPALNGKTEISYLKKSERFLFFVTPASIVDKIKADDIIIVSSRIYDTSPNYATSLSDIPSFKVSSVNANTTTYGDSKLKNSKTIGNLSITLEETDEHSCTHFWNGDEDVAIYIIIKYGNNEFVSDAIILTATDYSSGSTDKNIEP